MSAGVSRTCATTGLRLHASPRAQVWRIAKAAYGPLAPLPRSGDASADPQAWGRFDTRGGRTAYVAASRECAFAEMLAYFQRRLGRVDPLAKDAAALGLDVGALGSIVAAEWAERGHMEPGHLAVGWRAERRLYELQLPPDGWWIDVEHPDTIAAIRFALEHELAAVGVQTLDRSVILGPSRSASVLISTWVRALALDDGQYAHGITWQSKHGTGRCWGFWLRRVDDDADIVSEPLQMIGDGEPINAEDRDLIAVAERMGLRVW